MVQASHLEPSCKNIYFNVILLVDEICRQHYLLTRVFLSCTSAVKFQCLILLPLFLI